jgi:tRNA U34 5-methylaminomethyl-2-thiouridine-forming methyltransferase MnmC
MNNDSDFEKIFWQKHGYELVATEDQSPSLRCLLNPASELMHHRGGAYSETQLIYGEPFRAVIQDGGRSALSVGLGLGYNEILVATEAIQNQIAPSGFRLLSFESEAVLKEQFLKWCQASESAQVYDQIFEFFQAHSKAKKNEVQAWLREAFQIGGWQIEGALTSEFLGKYPSSQRYDCVFYDAFSSKTSPYLWEQEFLSDFFQKVTSDRCQVSTYACTGALKRALKISGFEVVLRNGFQSKRNSTLGIKRSSSNP